VNQHLTSKSTMLSD